MSSRPFVDITHHAKDSENAVPAACKQLITESRRRWEVEEGAYCDDITALIVDLRTHDQVRKKACRATA